MSRTSLRYLVTYVGSYVSQDGFTTFKEALDEVRFIHGQEVTFIGVIGTYKCYHDRKHVATIRRAV